MHGENYYNDVSIFHMHLFIDYMNYCVYNIPKYGLKTIFVH